MPGKSTPEQIRGQEPEKATEAMTFEKAKEDMVAYLMAELRKNQRNTIGGEVGVRRTEEISKYLTGIIQSMESGHLYPAREYFDGLKKEKEQAAAAAAGHLREVTPPEKKPSNGKNGGLEAAKTKEGQEVESKRQARQKEIDDLTKKVEQYQKKTDEARKAGDFKAMEAFSKEVGNLEDNIGRFKLDETRARQDLARAQNDPDLEKFTRFVRAIDEEMEKRVRQVA